LDVDGILTDGSIFFMEGQGWTRIYNIYDGYGIKLIQRLGIPVCVISGGHSNELKERLRVLGIAHAVLGSEDKLTSLNEIIKVTGIPASNICFMADELFDIPALQAVALAVTVPNAVSEVKELAHYITLKNGGEGAVREVIDHLRRAQGLSF
ncbi:MAG: HAD hydrolase family protein, partial [Bdellovibrionales bacterium]|nr:HAD hydrolase family protein [Oligoflexia bacterium]